MTSRLKLASGLTLPLDAVTETFAILAKRGVGKTHTASVMAEEMLHVGAQIVVIDPTDAWWGLRSSADGKTAGESIYVIGGNHADVPLEATAGTLLADLVVDSGVSIVLALRHLSKTKQRSFVAEFAERLYHRKGESGHQTPLHVFIDEADAFVPQGVKGDVARAYGAIDDIVRRGRSSGLGVTLISQRSAVVAKDVLTQCEVLIALRTVSPQDRKALDAWVEAHDAHDQRATFMDTIASLAIGEAWVWSPGWLDIFDRVQIRPRSTFDSSATPKAGERRVEPKRLASVDLDALGDQIRQTKERAEANDPKKLRARVAELEKKLAVAEQSRPDPVVETIEIKVPMVPAGLEAEVLREFDAVKRSIDEACATASSVISKHFGLFETQTVGAVSGSHSAADRVSARPRAASTERVSRKVPSAPATASPDGVKLGKAERAILAVLAQRRAGLSRKQLGFLSEYSHRSGNFSNALGSLRSAGYINRGEPIQATDEGVAALGDFEPLPTGPALYEYWLGRLPKAAREILAALVTAWPNEIDRETLGERTGYSSASGNFSNALGRLRSMDLVVGLSASDEFMEAIQ